MSEAEQVVKTDEELQEMIAETDSGARNPIGAFPKKVLFSFLFSGRFFSYGTHLLFPLYLISLLSMIRRQGQFIWPLLFFSHTQRIPLLNLLHEIISPFRIGFLVR